MKTKIISLVFTILMLFFAPALVAADNGGDYIKVEIKGTLHTGIMAVGGETTGTTIQADNTTWELDLGGDKKLQDSAANLDKHAVVVTGTYKKLEGIEIKERHVVKVATLKSAGEK